MTISSHPSPSEADQEALSAYLDNALSAAERLTIERRLQQEPSLQAELSELRAVMSMIGDLQPVVLPRSFTLDPATVRRPRGMPLFAILRLGGALATILLALTLTLDVFGSSGTASAPVAAPAQSVAQPTAGFAPQAAPAPTGNAAILQAPQSAAGAPPAAANSAAANDAATDAPAAAAPMARAAIQATAPAAAAAEDAGATEATQAAKSQPAIGAQPVAPGSSDTSSPDTNRTALPPPRALSVGISALRWAEIVLASLAIACGLGAFLAWQQRR